MLSKGALSPMEMVSTEHLEMQIITSRGFKQAVKNEEADLGVSGKLSVVGHTCNPSTLDPEAGGLLQV